MSQARGKLRPPADDPGGWLLHQLSGPTDEVASVAFTAPSLTGRPERERAADGAVLKQQAFGKSHPQVGLTLSVLSQLYSQLGAKDKAAKAKADAVKMIGRDPTIAGP
jgi:hypothetical protein